MTQDHRRLSALVVMLGLIGAPAAAQPIYGGGYWGGGYGGGQTVQGNVAQGMGMYAMGAGQYNLDTSQARATNAKTAVAWNQYLYQSRLESSRNYHAKLARDQARAEKGAEAVRNRLRNNPNALDIEKGDALNVILDELIDPKVYTQAVYYGHKMKLGGETIRDIPFSYAAAAISTSVHQLVQVGAPPVLKGEQFAPERNALRATAAELRKEAEERG